jgi:hypothetical protein
MKFKEILSLIKIIFAARVIQEFLWKEHRNEQLSLELWKRLLDKRLDKINLIQRSNPHWQVELRKRLLQNAALSLACINLIPKLKD